MTSTISTLVIASPCEAIQHAGYERTLCLHHGEPAKRHAVHRHHVGLAEARLGASRSRRSCFTTSYSCKLLVWYEMHSTMMDAIAREKQIKGGSRHKKLALIEGMNPDWSDLYQDLI